MVPDRVHSDGADCAKVAAAGGVDLLGWQADVLDGWLGRDRLDRWAAPTCGLAVPRQNGKTLGVVVPRIAYGMLVLGEECIYTSHLQKTSTETFESVADFFDQPGTRRYVKDVKTALGRESVVLKNGARVKFLARTRNGGRGQHGDLLVFDEALELDEESQASFLPAISASPNPQTVYTSTPPTPRSDGPVFRAIRERALSGKSAATYWAEWSVDEIGDVADRDRWYETNPSLGTLIREETVAGEAEQMDADTFARERLGWWSDGNAKSAIAASDWAACRVDDSAAPRDGVTVFAVKFAADGSRFSLAACVRPDEGRPYVQCIENRSMGGGVRWLADWLAAREDRAAAIVVDGRAYSGALLEKLDAAGLSRLQVVTPRSTEVATACAMLVNAVESHELSHTGQPALDDSATRCSKRKIGNDGGYGFAGFAGADPTLIEACALALWQALTTKRDQRRVARVG